MAADRAAAALRPPMTACWPARPYGDIQTAAATLVDRLAPAAPVARQPALARAIAAVIAGRRSTMGDAMFLRQSILRGAVATPDDVAQGLAAWVTVLFDLANLQHDRRRALAVAADLPDAAFDRLARAVARARHGCILAVPHSGSIELFAAHLRDRGVDLGFVHTIGTEPTPVERWIRKGRNATQATPIAFGRRNTGAEIARILARNGVVLMVADVYPGDRYPGIAIEAFDAPFAYPPGPARYARSGTLVLPGYAARRHAGGFSMDILEPIDAGPAPSPRDTARAFTQALADQVGAFIAARPDAYWLWHPIPNDPFRVVAQHRRPDLLRATAATPADDEVVARAVEALATAPALLDGLDPPPVPSGA